MVYRAASTVLLLVTAVTDFLSSQEGTQVVGVIVQVITANGNIGTIEGSFGKSGKFKVQFPGGVSLPASGSTAIQLTFKKFIFDKDKRHMAQ